ncbi:MAG TPA: Gfo/Idh/MocA family oxidoreductase, partial [Methanosarcinales archaeon]|nr:Gfo/Idh/MocA family oxidoreductase [Methanosarcinales archaeon]
MKNYVLIGGAGFVAPRHYNAIKETGGNLLAIFDPHDSVGVLDNHFPDCKYFSTLERFIRYCTSETIDYWVVCSPNHFHDVHCWMGLSMGSDVICEKPLVLNERNFEELLSMEQKSGHRIWNILQLRLSETAVHLKKLHDFSKLRGTAYLEYYTPRGDWYDYSWKMVLEKSGGAATNIGIHLFNLLLWLFGTDYTIMHWVNDKRRSTGTIRFGNFEITIILSIEKGFKPKRVLSINTGEFDFSKEFGDLHTLSYEKILAGEGFGIEDV